MHLNAAAAAQSLKEHPVRNLIGGELVLGESDFEVINPSTAQSVATAPTASPEQLDRAVVDAAAAQRLWATVSPIERRAALTNLASRLVGHIEDLAPLISLEQGKPLAAARREIERAAAMTCELASLDLTPQVLREDASGRIELHNRPIGVVGAITPWNMPVALSLPAIAHAVYSGNAVVLKPSPLAPLATLRMAELVRDLFPHGLVNVLAGGHELGERLCRHPGIGKISFTGSVSTGARVMSSAAEHLKSLTLELGGNDAAVVLQDADVEQAAEAIFNSSFGNSGQVCMAIKRLYVHTSIFEPLCERLAQLANACVVGDPFDSLTQLGPVQSRQQFDFLCELLSEIRTSEGAQVLSGGRALERPGYFLQPTIVAGLADEARLVVEEQFGPVLPILSFDDPDEAIDRANRSSFGLGASVWGRHTGELERLARRLEAGTVWINRHGGADPRAPFGGIKKSGLGRLWGREGLQGYTHQTTLFVPQSR